MYKKTTFTTIFALMFLLLAVTETSTIQNAKANPFFIFNVIDPIPGTIPPKITILSPQNNTICSLDGFAVSFNVSRPELGTCETAIIDVKYALDGKTTQAFSIWRNGSASNSWVIPEFNTTFAPALSAGNHSLTVEAEGVVYAGGMDIFFIKNSTMTIFSLSTQPAQLSPNPTPTASPAPSPTLTPTPTPPVTPSASPSPSPSPTSTPSSSPTVPEYSTWAILPLFTLATLTAFICNRKKENKTGGQVSRQSAPIPSR